MTGKERRITEMLGRARVFDTTYGAVFVSGSKGRQLFDIIGMSAVQSAQIAMQQDTGAGQFHGGTAQKELEARELKGLLRAIIDTARPAYKGDPALQKQFRMPADTDVALLTGARAIAVLVAQTAIYNELVARELPADFVTELEAAITDFDAASQAQDAGGQTRSGATAGLGDILQNGLAARDEVSPIVKNKFRDNAQILGAWKTASHVEKAPKKSPPTTP